MTIGTTEQGALELPQDAVTQGFGILARRRSGKSSTAGVMEETYCQRGDPWVCLDPVSAHWGIRYADDQGRPGKPSGYDVLIIGGKYGDVPLDEKGGASLAQILVDTDISCVVDLGGTSMNARQAYVADFAIELLRINETPRHVLLEEADEFVPQQLIWDNQKAVRGALTRLIKQGGGLGIGYTLISQRPASVAKDVLEQVDNLIVMRMSGPRDLKAVQNWFEHNVGDDAEMKRILGSLRGFKPGEAWWLSDESLVRLKVRPRTTYHAGRTPKRGEKPIAPRKVELGKVIEQFRAAATKRQVSVQADRDLKAQNAELRRQLKSAGKTQPAAAVKRPCGHEGEIAKLERYIDAKEREIVQVSALHEEFRGVVMTYANQILENGRGAKVAVRPLPKRTAPPAPAPVVRPAKEASPAKAPTPSTNGSAPVEGLSRPQQRILNTLATFEALGIDVMDRSTVAVYSEASPRSSAYANNLGRLSTMGLVNYPRGGVVTLTPAGRESAEAEETPEHVGELHERWFRILSGPQVRIIKALIEIYPEDCAKEQLAEWGEASATSSAYANNLGALRTLGLIEYPDRGRVVATSLLFPKGL